MIIVFLRFPILAPSASTSSQHGQRTPPFSPLSPGHVNASDFALNATSPTGGAGGGDPLRQSFGVKVGGSANAPRLVAVGSFRTSLQNLHK